MRGVSRCPTEARQSPCLAKLDRLDWGFGFNFECYGARFGVRSNDADLLDRIRQRLPPGARPDPGRKIVDVLVSARRAPAPSRPGLRGYHLLYLSITRVERSEDLDQIVAAFDQQIHLLVANFARRYVFVHAGCVAWHGRAIVVPGRTLSGKSTLVHALVAAGAAYLSDEYAVVDARGRVRAYPKPLSLRATATEAARLVSPGPTGTENRPPVPVGLVAVLGFARGARNRWRAPSMAEALMDLLANTVSVRRQPELALKYLVRALRSARAIKGRRGEAAEAAEKLIAFAGTGESRVKARRLRDVHHDRGARRPVGKKI